MTWARRREREPVQYPPRPNGVVVWVHATRGQRISAIMQLSARLVSQRQNAFVLVTLAPGVTGPKRLKRNIILADAPGLHPEDVMDFLDHWRPELCLWTCGDLVVSHIVTAAEEGVPLYLVDASETGFNTRPVPYLPDPTPAALGYFTMIMASDANAARRLRKLGLAEDDLTITGPLQEGSAAIPCNQSDLDALREAIGTRPVWLAAMVQPEELATILRAHRAVSRWAHRLMLVLVPDRPEMGDEMAERMQRGGMSYVRWSDGEFPDDGTEVLLADTYGEMGLWYRLSPASFMASSLVAGHGGCDPFEPAALGSAILYGPNIGRHLHAYSRLAEAGAARIVRDTDTLTNALKQLIAPDRAAAMSLAAWEIVSEGAQVTDRIMDLIHDTLDLAEVI
ncbi:glycosyltransferase N-terminal domain-containing protein [Marinovum sp. 2_MG-2023]|uniref:3-deoxy-D-manno-octulosonic acid transferase n=1 Tax=unclassified Marinovum TaxID=2647166 RepID=UPI0026E2105D|nr:MULTISPECIES: glycosyltransferase N-terminal domain-containing protein [unclassified Marinovum]MDO6730238.1 glycosyltransferase N-terminal domain-containing protein [Marinovum sp. 2_MG-2023]MDO6778976.1 glycosyltransferase N-terminal domain-containing protein [Marinovum sp. 1_MG-2023]